MKDSNNYKIWCQNALLNISHSLSTYGIVIFGLIQIKGQNLSKDLKNKLKLKIYVIYSKHSWMTFESTIRTFLGSNTLSEFWNKNHLERLTKWDLISFTGMGQVAKGLKFQWKMERLLIQCSFLVLDKVLELLIKILRFYCAIQMHVTMNTRWIKLSGWNIT